MKTNLQFGGCLTFALFLLQSQNALAQLAVYDAGVNQQSMMIASNTSQIMQSNNSILNSVNATLQAVSGARSTSNLANIALGSGFSMSNAPNFGSILTGAMNWGGLGQYAGTANQAIQSLNLVNRLTGKNIPLSGVDQAYTNMVNTTAALTGTVTGNQAASTARTSAITAASAMIGTTPDLKSAVDAGSQLTNQQTATVNELTATINAQNAALAAQNQAELAAQAKLSRMLDSDPSELTLP